MEFLNKLLPYSSLLKADSNSLTAWSALILLFIFFYFVLRLFSVTFKIRRRLQLFARDFNVKLIAEDKRLSKTWKEYEDSFVNLNGQMKSDEFAYDYFNEKNLLASNTNLRLINSVPATLVGLGILGTFIGLTYGISSFQTESTEEIKASIETLLSGMGTAFVSSIYGMLLSIIFTFIEKVQIHRLHDSVYKLCFKLDRIYRISREDERNIQLERQEALLKNFFIYTDSDGNEVKPSNLFRDLYKESEQQTRALKTFSTDLANIIEAGFERILNDPDQGVVHELNELKAEIIKLGEKLQDPATEMTQNVIANLEAAMERMVEEFKNTMSGSTKAELEGLAKMMGEAGNSLTDFPEKFREMSDTLKENFENIQVTFQEISRNTQQQSNESLTNLGEQIKGIGEYFKDQVGGLQIGQEQLITKQSENLEITDKLLNAFRTSIQELNSLSAVVNGTVSSFNEAQGSLNAVSNQLENISNTVLKSSESFLEVQHQFSIQTEDFLQNNSATLIELKDALSKAKELSDEYVQKFDVIEAGLKGIFGQIGEGLEEYRDTVGDSMEMFLSKYTEALTKTAESLSGAASKQEDILVELTEQLDKFRSPA